jgi:hypothetical protein
LDGIENLTKKAIYYAKITTIEQLKTTDWMNLTNTFAESRGKNRCCV